MPVLLSQDPQFSYNPTSEELDLLNLVESLPNPNDTEDQGLAYVAGYAAFRFKNKYPKLGTPTEMLVNPNNDWINYISRGRLLSPNADLLKVAKHMNNVFLKYHPESSLRKEPWIFKTVANIVEDELKNITQIPREVLSCLVRTRTYIRVRIINKQFQMKKQQAKDTKKMTKFTNRKP